jgi:hypothetical protein
MARPDIFQRNKHSACNPAFSILLCIHKVITQSVNKEAAMQRGTTHSEETRAKMRGRWTPERRKATSERVSAAMKLWHEARRREAASCRTNSK